MLVITEVVIRWADNNYPNPKKKAMKEAMQLPEFKKALAEIKSPKYLQALRDVIDERLKELKLESKPKKKK